MASNHNVMIQVQAVLSPELYQELCAYINDREDRSEAQGYSEGYDEGWEAGLDQGRFNWGP